HLAEDVARATLADNALDPVDELHRLDAALEHGEERALAALVGGVFARDEADVRRHAGELLALGRIERREERDRRDFVSSDHVRRVLVRPTPPTRPRAGSARRTLTARRWRVCALSPARLPRCAGQ